MTDETGDTGENRVNARRSQSLPSRDDRCAADDRLDSPVRKLPRRQSVPARLSSHKDYSGNGGGVGDSSTRIPVEGHQLVVKGVTGRSERLKKVRPSRRKQGMHRRSTPSRLAPQIREDESCSGNSAEELIPLPPPRKHSARVTAAERPWKGAPWAPPDYLSGGQKKIYFHVSKMCDMVATQPLPIRVVSLTGHGEFFDRGDLAPRQATLIVGGDEDPLVADLRFDELLSAALAERARRRNAQMSAVIGKALRLKRGADGKPGGANGGEGNGDDSPWWSQLSANKHLMENDKVKLVRDGEPLGTVADGAEWALMQEICGRNANSFEVSTSSAASSASSCQSPPSRASVQHAEDVALLVKVTRLWAGCLSWRQVSMSKWSYPGITARLLKEGLHSSRAIQVFIDIREPCPTAQAGKHRNGPDCYMPKPGWKWNFVTRDNFSTPLVVIGECVDYPGSSASRPSDQREDFPTVTLWGGRARDVRANLNALFVEDGIGLAVRKTAASLAGRMEMMTRCSVALRIGLEDLIAGKASVRMMKADNYDAVIVSYLLWLKDAVASQVKARWARDDKALSQVIACVASSIKREGKLSDAVAVWFSQYSPIPTAATARVDKDGARARSNHGDRSENGVHDSDATKVVSPRWHVSRGNVVTEKQFTSLKREEASQAQKSDTLAVMVNHALYLLLPCQPIQFHMSWAKFMTFFNTERLNNHIQRYHVKDTRRIGKYRNPKLGGTGTTTRSNAPSAALAAEQVAAAAAAAHQEEHEARPLSRFIRPPPSPSSVPSPSHLPRPLRCQAARNLVKPRRDSMARVPPGFHRGPRYPEDTGEVFLTQTEVTLFNECLVSLLARHGTVNRLATSSQMSAALRRQGFPNPVEALALIKNGNALKGIGVRDKLWRVRRGAALVRARVEKSLYARLPLELFRHVLIFLAS